MKPQQLPNDGFVRISQLVPGIVPVARSTFWRMVRQGQFPRPVKLSAGVTAWSAKEVRDWIATRGVQ